jgi:hypothetical protein
MQMQKQLSEQRHIKHYSNTQCKGQNFSSENLAFTNWISIIKYAKISQQVWKWKYQINIKSTIWEE